MFAAIGALGVLQWSRLVADPGVGPLLALAIVTAGGAAMIPQGGQAAVPYARVAALAIAVLATAAATVVVGLPARSSHPRTGAS